MIRVWKHNGGDKAKLWFYSNLTCEAEDFASRKEAAVKSSREYLTCTMSAMLLYNLFRRLNWVRGNPLWSVHGLTSMSCRTFEGRDDGLRRYAFSSLLMDRSEGFGATFTMRARTCVKQPMDAACNSVSACCIRRPCHRLHNPSGVLCSCTISQKSYLFHITWLPHTKAL